MSPACSNSNDAVIQSAADSQRKHAAGNCGSTVGMVLAGGVVYLLRGMLYRINASDGIYFVVVATSFLVVAVLASYPPVR